MQYINSYFLLMPLKGADFFASIGKIYVVVAVILLIFIGVVIYLIRLDRKISKLEAELNNGN